MPKIATSAWVLFRQTRSAIGTGQPVCMLTATASGTAASTAAASDSVRRGLRWSLRHSSSSNRPMRIGVLRTWKVLAPMRALARFSFTYAFIPEMIATTATRNATDTMIPSSVKNDRSLLTRICWSAVVITSEKRILLISATSGSSATRIRARRFRLLGPQLPAGRLYLFVPQRLYRVEPCRAGRGQQPEQNPGEGARSQRRDHRREWCRCRNSREGGLYPQRHQDAEHESDRCPDAGQRRCLDQELPENRALGGAQRLANADLARPLGDADHHDRHDADASDQQPNRRQRQSDDEEGAEQLVVDAHQPVLRHDLEVVLGGRPKSPTRAHQRGDVVGGFFGGDTRLRLDDQIDAAHPRVEAPPCGFEGNNCLRLIATTRRCRRAHRARRVVIDADHLKSDSVDVDHLVYGIRCSEK